MFTIAIVRRELLEVVSFFAEEKKCEVSILTVFPRI